MIGIIGAMDVEIHELKKLAENPAVETISGIDFISGTILGKSAVIAKCGCGKVNAALCTEAMILKFSPEAIINTGVAGGLEKSLGIADIVVATDVVQHDYDTTPLGEPAGYISHINTVKIPCDRRICSLLTDAASILGGTKVINGIIATGDQFLNGTEQKKKIINTFGAAAGEMEGGAIGHVCYANNVPFGVIRAISDNADGSSHMDFEQFTEIAAAKTIEIIKQFICNF